MEQRVKKEKRKEVSKVKEELPKTVALSQRATEIGSSVEESYQKR